MKKGFDWPEPLLYRIDDASGTDRSCEECLVLT